MKSHRHLFLAAFVMASLVSGCQSAKLNAGLNDEAMVLLEDPEPLPEIVAFDGKDRSYLTQVLPEPGGMISRSNQEEWTLMLGHQKQVGDICVVVRAEALVRKGDDFQQANAQLTFDGKVVDESKEVHHPMGGEFQLWYRGELFATGMQWDSVCWSRRVSTGIHLAELTVWTSDDEEYHYSWAFEVVP